MEDFKRLLRRIESSQNQNLPRRPEVINLNKLQENLSENKSRIARITSKELIKANEQKAKEARAIAKERAYYKKLDRANKLAEIRAWRAPDPNSIKK